MRGSFTPLGVSALVMIALAVAFGVGSLKLGFWDHGIPGSGLMPMIASLALLPLAFILLVQAIRGREGRGEGEGFQLLPIATLVLLWVYVAALPRLGFAIPTAVMLFILVKFIYGRGLLPALLVSLLVTAGGVMLFSMFLDTPIQVWPHA